MKIDSADFNTLVDRALQAGQITHMRPVVEKELLHYDILFCLDQAGLLDSLVFQGGTSLRLCYGGNRLSEDLGFAGGVEFSAVKLAKMKDCIERYIGARYGLEVTVKEPALLKKDLKYSELKINKWQIAVVTAPERKGVPKQKMKIEVANIPAYTKQPLPLTKNYDFLPDGYDDMLVLTKTIDEILADKLVSLSATQKYIRYRDLWDLPWLLQQGAKLNAALVKRKVNDYKIAEFNSLLNARIESLPSIINDGRFSEEMRRFLPSDVFNRTLGDG
ncbi:MAG: nucleotidyl transferase AbiEii/AbiGii toxin family protein [Marinagarivorans sp.]|nr:nucleotidyl transferase AbiEii/AbiGii toxin family protein [Marinagarivorans sp.]